MHYYVAKEKIRYKISQILKEGILKQDPDGQIRLTFIIAEIWAHLPYSFLGFYQANHYIFLHTLDFKAPNTMHITENRFGTLPV